MKRKVKGPGAAATATGAEGVGLANATMPSTAKHEREASPFGLPPDPDGERDHEQILAAWKKPGRKNIFVIVGVREFHGRKRLDIREWVDGIRATGHGISLSLADAKTLLLALQSLDQEE